jgi:hypothetical protein
MRLGLSLAESERGSVRNQSSSAMQVIVRWRIDW